ncbi:MAG: cyclase family protein [Planctomycetes bacterium]|nr:cyclase family protein [Planctomycetota bacterium]
MPRLIDISPLVSERIAVWPDDVPYRRRASLSIAQGANIDLSAVETTVHLGAHADAPSHYAAGAPDIAARPLELYYGPCQVMWVDVARGARVLPEHLPDEVATPRLLLRTGTFPDPEAWNADFASLSPELIEHLAARGAVLVGIDTPSVDPYDDRALLTHQALLRHGIANLEGLVLEQAPPGRYTLVALPLRLEGADASPVRAALVAER